MKSIGIFYGSTTGNTQKVAVMAGEQLGAGAENVMDIASSSIDRMAEYDILLLGSSTWGIGDLQDDWEAVISGLEGSNLSGKQIAVFGTGDSASYSDSFCDAVGILADAVEKAGGELVGQGMDLGGYDFIESKANRGGTLCGLLIDEDNEPDKTDQRVGDWVGRIKSDCGL